MKKKFSDHVRDSLKNKSDSLSVILADKIKVQEFVEKSASEFNLFSHHIWKGYDLREAMENIKPPCVIKMNNAWRRLLFINSEKDIKGVREKLQFWMSDIGKSWEWYYKEMRPGIIIEKRLPDKIHDLYRCYAFGGKLEYFFIQRFDTTGNIKITESSIYSPDGEIVDVIWYKMEKAVVDFSDGHNKILKIISEKIANSFDNGPPPFLRVDLFIQNGKPLFSEMTLVPEAFAGHYFEPDDLDYKMGELYRNAGGK